MTTHASPTAAGLGMEELLSGLRRSFLEELSIEKRQIIEAVHSGADLTVAEQLAHRWAGRGGTLGFPEISKTARLIEEHLQRGDAHSSQDLLALLERISCDVPPSTGASPARVPKLESSGIPPVLYPSLSGVRFILSGFDAESAHQLSSLLEQAGGFAREALRDEASVEARQSKTFDMLFVRIADGPAGGLPGMIERAAKPTLVVGPQESLIRLSPQTRERCVDFLFEPFGAEEAVIRAALLLQRQEGKTMPGSEDVGAAAFRVVVADDDPTITSLVKRALQNHGFECMQASDGGEALERISEFKAHAVVLDINMPNLDGFEVLARIRDNPKTENAKVLLLTARQQEMDVIRGFGLGADDYVVKPFSPMELVARLNRLLGRRG